MGFAQDSTGTTGGSKGEFEVFPIVSYDTDTGFGYGLKFFALNYLERDESVDLVLFNSTKGERWYRLVFSIPDFERRQGTVYDWAVDLTVDYDKWISYSFFGVGNTSSYEDRETYTRIPFELSVMVSRGFSTRSVGQLGLRYVTVLNRNFSEGSQLVALPPPENASRATLLSLAGTFRYDSRDSYVNPTRGAVVQAEGEVAPRTGFSNVAFTRVGGWIQLYHEVFAPKLVLAGRVGMQTLSGSNIPVQMLMPIGGNKTVRGSVQDRYLDMVSIVSNLELRFPIVWRFGGLIGVDAGKVWHSVRQIDLARWATNPVIGLRFFMDTFLVRLDVGFGRETTGFYLNFGQIF
jgi:outer membrane protein assembly factor BamA